MTGRAEQTVPVVRMIALAQHDIAPRADRLISALCGANIQAEPLDGFSTIGGGSAPGAQLPTSLVAIRSSSLSANAIESALRRQTPPVIARIEEERLLLDLRTVDPEEDALLARLVIRAAAGSESCLTHPQLQSGN
jgi:L-seryl-tRNA(Ser) seleniumtransferase